MKKVLALSLALILALSLGVSAFAAATAAPDFDFAVDEEMNDIALTVLSGTAAPGATIKIEIADGGGIEDYDDFVDDYTFTYKVVEGSVASVKVVDKKDALPQIEVKLADDFAPKAYDLDLDLKFRDKSSGKTEVWNLASSKIGYATTLVFGNADPTDDLLDKEDGEADLDLDVDGPVFDFDDCDDTRYEYNMYYLGTMEATWKGVEGGKLYLGVNTDVDTDLLKTYEDIDFEELNFEGKPTLGGTAKIYFYTDDDKTCLYEVKDGKFVPVTGAEYNKTEGAWVFSARTLGDYVASSKAIPDAAAEGGKTNPNTGANGFVNLAVVAAVVSLAAVGAVSLKK